MLYCLFRGVMLDVGVVGALFVGMGLNLAVALPLQTMGGFGLVEGAMAFLLGVLGVPVTAAVTAAVAVRILWLVLMGACTAAWLALRQLFEPAPTSTSKPI